MAENESKGRKILVAVDEGEESMYALSWCLGNITIQNSKDTIVLLYAKPPLAVYSGLDGTAGMGGKFSCCLWAILVRRSVRAVW